MTTLDHNGFAEGKCLPSSHSFLVVTRFQRFIVLSLTSQIKQTRKRDLMHEVLTDMPDSTLSINCQLPQGIFCEEQNPDIQVICSLCNQYWNISYLTMQSTCLYVNLSTSDAFLVWVFTLGVREIPMRYGLFKRPISIQVEFHLNPNKILLLSLKHILLWNKRHLNGKIYNKIWSNFVLVVNSSNLCIKMK